jgi:hypothetical protein
MGQKEISREILKYFEMKKGKIALKTHVKSCVMLLMQLLEGIIELNVL